MKFHELEEGKKYRSSAEQEPLELKNGLLWYVNLKEYAVLRMDYVAEMNFEEVIEYVTFEEALEHMKNGGRAEFDQRCYEFDKYGFLQYSPIQPYSSSLKLDMLEPKWQLI